MFAGDDRWNIMDPLLPSPCESESIKSKFFREISDGLDGIPSAEIKPIGRPGQHT